MNILFHVMKDSIMEAILQKAVEDRINVSSDIQKKTNNLTNKMNVNGMRDLGTYIL